MTFCVYELIDPRDGKAFYVGKGRHYRPRQHLRDARRGKLGRKCERIREILAAGLEVLIKEIRIFEDEALAYAFERRHIAEIGLENLTNITIGGGGVKRGGHGSEKVEPEELVALFRRVASRPEPKGRPWAAALHRAVVRALPRLIENRI